MEEKRIDDYWKCRFEQKFVTFMDRLQKIHIIERNSSQGIYVVREETDKSWKRLRDQIMYSLRYDPKLGKPLRIEKTRIEN